MDFDTYERIAWADYAAFAQAVSSILKAIIRTDNTFRLQEVTCRHKSSKSLKEKLHDRNLFDSTIIEDNIKDLAGCRVIFYTNDDVSRFINSVLMHDNFEILEVRVHHPNHDTETAVDLYMANHYVVKLRAEREALSEYARFAGMRCEVQVQTILNHAWAEMAHDIIYKRLMLNGFGNSAFERIDRRMHKVMRRYLLPAGHEFGKILRDFERLRLGKELFDRGALEEILHASNNNELASAIERFSEHVLPLYNNDDLNSEYPQIVATLVKAIRISQRVLVVDIETPYGSLPGKTVNDITSATVDVLDTCKYVDIELTFNALCTIFLHTVRENERRPLLQLAKSLSQHDLQVWNNHGPAVQAILIAQLKTLPSDQVGRLQSLLLVILCEILKTQVTGTSSTSNTVSWSTGVVVASETLSQMRHDAINILKQIFNVAQTDADQWSVLNTLAEATRTPSLGMYSNELIGIIIRDSAHITTYYTDILQNLSYDLLQRLENIVFQVHCRFRHLPSDIISDPLIAKWRNELTLLIQIFRDQINADSSFVIYKTLIGFDSLCPHAWDSGKFDYREATAYQNERLDELLKGVEESNSEEWLSIIKECAAVQSNDSATFTRFRRFLTILGETKPNILMGYLDQIDENLSHFLPEMLNSLVKSTYHDMVLSKVDDWVTCDKYLIEIVFHLRSSDSFDERLLLSVFARGLSLCDDDVVLNSLFVAVDRHAENVFLPAVAYFASKCDARWAETRWLSWHGNALLASLDADQATAVLGALIPCPNIEDSVEELVAAVAIRWPQQVIEFFGNRIKFKNKSAVEAYRAFPFSIHRLREPLAAAPMVIITSARVWFNDNEEFFHFNGGHFIAQVFPDFDDSLRMPLKTIVQEADPRGIDFVLAVLHSYEGKSFVDSLCMDIIEVLDHEDALLRKVASVLRPSGSFRGELGIADAYARKKAEMGPWLDHPCEKVRSFAIMYMQRLDQYIAHERRSAEEAIARRKLEYDEELNED